MKKKTGKMPAQIEWDFRSIAYDQLRSVARYEYARTSDVIRPAIATWLNTDHHGKTLAQALFDERDHWQQERILFAHFATGLEAASGNCDLLETISKLPYFPKPFLFFGKSPLVIKYPLGKDRPKNKPPFSRIRIEPFEMVADRATREAATSEADFLRMAYPGQFKLAIRWDGFTTKEILNDFRKWLAVEAKKHPEAKPIGKRGQTQYWPLAWLAALRINRAGVTFADAQTKLRAAGKDFYHVLPTYSEKAGWSKAIAKAEKILAELEAGKDMVGL